MKSELMRELFNDMLESTEVIEHVEKNFGRELTPEERAIVLKDGEQGLLNKLGLSVEDYFTMQRAFTLISAGFTQSSDTYDEELEKENYKALDLFKSLVNDLECVAAARRKVIVGKKEELGAKSKIEIPKEDDHGYSEKRDSELDSVFQDSVPREELTEQQDRETDKNCEKRLGLDKVFSAATECKEMGITGDTYEEDDASWKEDQEIDKIISRLDKGCEIELDDTTLDAVVEKLWNTRNDVSIKIHNNKISLR